MKPHRITCPQCNRGREPLTGLTVNDITTKDDKEWGLVRYAIRCEGCGYATAFLATGQQEEKEGEEK